MCYRYNPCCQCLIQTFLFVFNIVVFLLSAGVISIAIYSFIDSDFNRSVFPENLPDVIAHVFFDESGNTLESPVAILMIVSAIILFVSFIGCLGPWQRSRCLVALYTIAYFVFLVLLMVGTCWTFLGDVEGAIGNVMNSSMARYETRNETMILWDKIQVQLECCGVEGVSDWETILNSTSSSCLAPHSCLDNSTAYYDSYLDVQQCLSDSTQPHYTAGCLVALVETLGKYKNIIAGIVISVWMIAMINFIFSFALCVVFDYIEYTYK